MKKKTIITLSLAILFGLFHSSAFSQARPTPKYEPDSEYIEKKDTLKRRNGGGLFSFLPFVGRSKTRVEPEKLEPSPPPQESKPALREKELEQLRGVAERWALTSEFIEPTVRQDEHGRYYRDYIVFADEYEAKVMLGDSEARPFIGHIYIKGDYFQTRSHDTPDDARSDFKFEYQTREFRVIFDRVEKWQYSYEPNDEPFAFVKRWEFGGLQSRPVVNLSKDILPSESPVEKEDVTPAPQAEGLSPRVPNPEEE